MNIKPYILSKSSFLRGNKCIKSLYLSKFHKEHQSPVSPTQKAIFEQGKTVGILAQSLFPNGIDVSPKDYFGHEDSIRRTHDAIKEGQTIYEASFLNDKVYAALDILSKDEEGWKGYEVKSSTEITEENILDAALQYYLIQNSGITLKDIFIIYINNEYVRSEKLEIDKLFSIKSILKEVVELQSIIPKIIEELKNILKQNEIPNTDIGIHCNKPYSCDFKDHCWKHVPSNSVFDIANLRTTKKLEFYNQGIIDLKDIPKDFKLNENQWQQINSELKQITIIDKPKIKTFVEELSFPLSFLDFESFQLAIPKYTNSKPYQQLVSQYSLHKIMEKEGELFHFEFIAEINAEDPRISFIENLIIDCGDKGDILIYNIAFERARLQELQVDFPEYYNSIQNIIIRLKDLMIPFKSRWYYVPAMKGSYSIKAVLPALVPKFSYSNLEIKDGSTASTAYSSMVQGTFLGDIDKTKKALLEYCKLDTLAMVEILKVLNEI